MSDPNWLMIARSYIGLAEIPGKEHSPTIAGWLTGLKAWWRDDETPWCGVFVAECMRASAIELPKHWYRAKGWLDWGVPIAVPIVGCVVVYERKGGGHVGIVVGKDQRGNLMTLGGNQGNKVSIMPFALERAIGFRFPQESLPVLAALPVVNSDGAASTQEA